MGQVPILQLQNVSKLYPGVVALDDVSMSFSQGSVHAVVGENGAGKSTFIKSITGAISPTSGDVIFDGEKVSNNNPESSLAKGIAAIYQEFSLVPFLSVAENIYLGRWPRRGGMVDRARMEKDASQVLKRLGVSLDPKTQVKDLSVAYQQLVEIARAISRDLRVLIMDEPSAPLTENEMSYLYDIVRQLKTEGVAIIYISHRMEEIFEICDDVSVLRDGKHVVTKPVADTTEQELIELMVDRPLDRVYPRSTGQITATDAPYFKVENLSSARLHDVSFTAQKGEILGLAGLVGAGRTEVARAVFGADKRTSGQIWVDGQLCKIGTPQDAVAAGIGLIPEDRKTQGLLLNLSIADNVVFASMKKVSRGLLLNKRLQQHQVVDLTKEMRVRAPSTAALVSELSGGNQQKVVLAKWLMTDSKVLFFDEPTRGIDVGAKQEIYELMRQLAAGGKTIVMISSELPELLGMSDRVLVMHEGRIAAELSRDEATPERVIALSSGLPTLTS